MPYKRKTVDEYQLHANYGYGFEEVAAAATYKELKQLAKSYRENEPVIIFKIKKVRIKL